MSPGHSPSVPAPDSLGLVPGQDWSEKIGWEGRSQGLDGGGGLREALGKHVASSGPVFSQGPGTAAAASVRKLGTPRSGTPCWPQGCSRPVCCTLNTALTSGTVREAAGGIRRHSPLPRHRRSPAHSHVSQ